MPADLSKQEIRHEVERLAPFHHKIGLPHNLSTFVPELSRRQVEHTRVDNLVRHAFPALLDACGGSLKDKRVLDAACNCGGFSVEAARLGSEYVLGFDSMHHYIEQANFIKRALALNRVDFKVMDIDRLDESSVGRFDVTFCFGILYHLENPVYSMKRLASVTGECMLVDTNVIRTPAYLKPFRKGPFWLMNFPALSTADSCDASTSLWRDNEQVVQFNPSETAVVSLLKFLGFPTVKKIKPVLKGLEKRYYTGRRTSFLALRS